MLRSKDDIETEYKSLCAELGDLQLKKEDLVAREQQIKARVSALNTEMQIVLAVESKEANNG